MQILGHENRDARSRRHPFQAPAQVEFSGESREFVVEGVEIKAVERPFHAHEEHVVLVVDVLFQIEDVSPVLEDEPGDRATRAHVVDLQARIDQILNPR